MRQLLRLQVCIRFLSTAAATNIQAPLSQPLIEGKRSIIHRYGPVAEQTAIALFTRLSVFISKGIHHAIYSHRHPDRP